MLVVGFLVLPLVGIFIHADLARGLRSSAARSALGITFETSTVALVAMVLLGTPTAYLMATREFRGKALVATLLELPLVLPPAVAGIGLFTAFGRNGLLGTQLHWLGLELPFTQAAVVMAMSFVAGPLYVRQAGSAFAAVDRDLLAAARTLGAGTPRVFLRVAVPVAAPGLGAGAALGWSRAVGEFGATILFAGSLQGVTQTAPIAIYLGFEQDFNAALALAAVLIAISAAVLLAVRLLVARGAPRFGPA